MARERCSDLVIGWTHVEDRREILQIVGLEKNDLPVLYGVDKRAGCEWIYKGRLMEAGRTGLIDKVVKGTWKTVFYVVLVTVVGIVMFVGKW